jgi:hypothetical protein
MADELTYGGPTILSHPFVVQIVLPFLLVFTLVFAILQKSKILGDDKRQIDAIVSLVIGLVVISFGYATGIIVRLIPFLAVSLVILLVLMLLLSAFHKQGDFDKAFPNGLKKGLMVVVLIAVIVAVMYITDGWQYVLGLFTAGGSTLVLNIIFALIVIGAILWVVFGSKGESGGDKGK